MSLREPFDALPSCIRFISDPRPDLLSPGAVTNQARDGDDNGDVGASPMSGHLSDAAHGQGATRLRDSEGAAGSHPRLLVSAGCAVHEFAW